MRILFVTHRYPPHTGGIETHVQEIAIRLADRGHEVSVFSADADDDVPTEHTDDGVRVRRFRAVAPSDAYHVAPRILAAVRRADYDVLHAHNYHAFPLILAAAGHHIGRFVATPHYHGGSGDSLRDRLLSLYRPLGQYALRVADEVVAVSDWESRQLRNDFGIDPNVVPNGLDVGEFANATPRRRDRPYLLCVGRLEEYKGVQHALRALPELPEYDLLVAGSGPHHDQLREITERTGIEDRVEWLGYVDEDALPSLYAGADAFLSLSEFEAYGMTVAEALASGTPCVVREAGALSDWIAHSGVIGVPNPTPNAVASAVQSVAVTSPDVAIPTWDDVVGDLEALYAA